MFDRRHLQYVCPMATTTRTLMTIQEFEATSRIGDRRQLVGGEVVVNEPGWFHARVQHQLGMELGLWARAAPGRGIVLPPIDVVLGEQDWYAPDLVWFSEAHRPTDRDKHMTDRPPGLVVEIRSPSTWRYDVGHKRTVYEGHGIAEAWFVDDRSDSVLVYRRSAPGVSRYDVALELTEADQLTSPLLPGFAVEVAALFRT